VGRVAGNDEVWRSAFDTLRLVCGGDARRERLNEASESRAVSMFGSVARLQLFLDLSAVILDGACGHASRPGKLGPTRKIVTIKGTDGQYLSGMPFRNVPGGWR
jgi:hypothetical protein